jgi:ribose transport system substrate-binding protein
MREHKFVVTGLAVAVLGLIVGACGSDDDAGTEQTTVAASKSGVMLGPNGEKATPAEEISLSEDDAEALRSGAHTAAIVWHDAAAEFSVAMTAGIRDRFDELGIEVVAVTDAQFDAGKQQRDVESVVARDPDSIISIPVDPVSAAKAFRTALDRGTQLTFLSNIPQGYKHGKDYVGVVSADQILTGQNTAQVMCEALGGEGKIGVIDYDADFFITNQRDAAFRQALADDCPEIEVAAQAGFEDPARVQEIASAMLTRNPDLGGIYTTWAQPAEGVLAALREAGREEDVKVATVDLSESLALDIAEGGATAGVSADRVYEAGRKLADVVGLGLLDRPAPAFAVVPSVAVTEENLLEGWQESYGEPAPAAVQEEAGS